ncbi:hypothetical protein ACXKU5_002842 [Yersinia enterocolitica]|uniref:Uncharacterized protein n=3 Tax=Yersinia TaxID=629 RepID=A0A0T9TP72_YERAE|nr:MULTISPECIES: hypothetical protein [Yersinia]AKF37313.1 hypothetical protein FORC2_1166 [Yersinia enterocolitica]ALG46092.1 hypothetical protein LI89_15625 [Yersinia enterocolitica]EKN4073618.1 hypothetical protein [Yersinia enterocolitica]EKN4144125.1 hypothetical protein [Yersinia enterocolitica]EKN4193809.1 hypothetical protein [Yersinia enterocolitica]
MKEQIYIGELVLETLPPNSTLTVGNSTNTLLTIKNETTEITVAAIDTSTWVAGFYSVVLNTGSITITNVTVINPMAQTDRLIELQKQLDDINDLITARISGDVSQLTINNKTLIHENLDTLLNLKNSITKQVNTLKKKIIKNNNNGFFKSIIHCRTR